MSTTARIEGAAHDPTIVFVIQGGPVPTARSLAVRMLVVATLLTLEGCAQGPTLALVTQIDGSNHIVFVRCAMKVVTTAFALDLASVRVLSDGTDIVALNVTQYMLVKIATFDAKIVEKAHREDVVTLAGMGRVLVCAISRSKAINVQAVRKDILLPHANRTLPPAF